MNIIETVVQASQAIAEFRRAKTVVDEYTTQERFDSYDLGLPPTNIDGRLRKATEVIDVRLGRFSPFVKKIVG